MITNFYHLLEHELTREELKRIMDMEDSRYIRYSNCYEDLVELLLLKLKKEINKDEQ